jgi:hypothetical protein
MANRFKTNLIVRLLHNNFSIQKNGWKGSIINFLIVVFVPIYLMLLRPLSVYFIFILFKKFSVEQLICTIIICAVEWNFQLFSNPIYSIRQANKLNEFYKEIQGKGPRCDHFALSDYDSKSFKILNNQRPDDIVIKNNLAIGRVLIYYDKSKIFPGFKAFPNIPFVGMSPDSEFMFLSTSSIIVNEDLSKMTDIRKFMYYHEIGHLSDRSQKFERLQYDLLGVFGFDLILILLLNSYELHAISIALIVVFLPKFYRATGKILEDKIEYFCDVFALSFFDNEERENLSKYFEVLYSKSRNKMLNDLISVDGFIVNLSSLSRLHLYILVHCQTKDILLSIIPVLTYFYILIYSQPIELYYLKTILIFGVVYTFGFILTKYVPSLFTKDLANELKFP